MTVEFPYLATEADGPKILVAIGLFEDDPHGLTGATIIGVSSDRGSLETSLRQRFTATPNQEWKRGDESVPGVDYFDDIAIVEFPSNSPEFELRLESPAKMRNSIAALRGESSNFVP